MARRSVVALGTLGVTLPAELLATASVATMLGAFEGALVTVVGTGVTSVLFSAARLAELAFPLVLVLAASVESTAV